MSSCMGYLIVTLHDQLDNMTLAHFAVWYKTVSGGENNESEVTSGRLPCFQLQNGMIL